MTLLDDILQPGPKLDVLVTSITDVEGSPSTDPATAMEAWEWLEENHPWDGYTLALLKPSKYDYRPGVYLVGYTLEGVISQGQDYPHAIALAVVRAGKALEII